MMVESLRLRKKLCARKAAAGGPEGKLLQQSATWSRTPPSASSCSRSM